MPSLELDPGSTALVLIDLHQGIVAGRTVPHAAAGVVDPAVSPTIGRVRSTDDLLASLA
jgi:hypothetical protein